MKQYLQRLCKEAAYAPPSPEEDFIGMQLPCKYLLQRKAMQRAWSDGSDHHQR
jgi:hypothetical protein